VPSSNCQHHCYENLWLQQLHSLSTYVLVMVCRNISGQGLQGFISDQITLLTHLTTLWVATLLLPIVVRIVE
jgi:hypothetical protein